LYKPWQAQREQALNPFIGAIRKTLDLLYARPQPEISQLYVDRNSPSCPGVVKYAVGNADYQTHPGYDEFELGIPDFDS